jgi:hypothetical protein
MTLETFKKLICFMYSEMVEFLTLEDLIPLFRAADLYDVQSLKDALTGVLFRYITEKNWFELYQKFVKEERIEIFKKSFANFFVENESLFLRKEFEMVDQDTMIEVCKLKILQI